MDFERFLDKLYAAKYKSCIENAYSHIINEIMNIVLDNKKYSLIDTSTWRRVVDENIVPKDIIACPDFVITGKEYMFNKTHSYAYGCIEAKFTDNDIKNPTRLKDDDNSIGYLKHYKHVLYTNGWIWVYYKGTDEPVWTIDFHKHPTNKEYFKLLYQLSLIDWNHAKEVKSYDCI